MEDARRQMSQTEESCRSNGSIPELVTLNSNNNNRKENKENDDKLKNAINVATQTIQDYVSTMDYQTIMMIVVGLIFIIAGIAFGMKRTFSKSNASQTNPGGINPMSNTQRFKSI